MTKHLRITVEGKIYDVVVEDVSEDAGSTFYQLPSEGVPSAAPSAPAPRPAPAAATPAPAAAAGAEDKVAPLGGVIIEISVKEGDKVKKGDQVAVIEAMKMKTMVAADHDGTVRNIQVKVGDAVDAGQVLMTIG
jgi:glutaconyl-CoA/methylmalonyl-CoA decarboxylase subunit gamma